MAEEAVGVSIDIMEHDRGSSMGVSIDIMEHDRGSSRCVYRHHGT